MRLDLVVPHLLLPRDARDAFAMPRLPFLERLFARGDRLPVVPLGYAQEMARRFGLPGERLPIAALTLAGDDQPRPGHWLRADPVHLAVERDALVLRGAATLAPDEAEATALAGALNAHFARDGLELLAPRPARWYLRVPEGEMPVTTPLDDAIGRNVFGRLPQSSGRINWRSLVTEAQMVLSAHEVNLRRERAGQLPINSLWLWGEGAMPGTLRTAHDAVFADEPMARGLATLAGLGAKTPLDIGVILRSGAASSLAVADALSGPWHRGDPDEWRAAAEALDRSLFRPAWEGLGEFTALAIHLPSPGRTVAAQAASSARWRFWRGAEAIDRDA
jgi:hypothetical protein